MIREAYDAGVRLFGENKVQEAVAKAEVFADVPDLRWAVIGHLQTNKAKQVAAVAAEFHALDSLRLAEALDRRLHDLDRTLDVFVQVNSSGEESKFGLAAGGGAGVRAGADAVRHPAGARADDPRGVLRRHRSGRRLLRPDARSAVPVAGHRRPLRSAGHELSMGMSGDYELAIAYGATTVRVGQAIFGDRLDPNDYWPVSGR